MPAPRFWLIAGPNGAGKSTLVRGKPLHDLVPPVHSLNTDDRTLLSLQQRGYMSFQAAPPTVLVEAFAEASDAVFGEIVALLEEGKAVCVETVLSTDKYCPVVNQVTAAGGYFALVYVALRSPGLAAERVAGRVRAGGHDVPAGKIQARWRRSLEWLPWFAARASAFWVFDNSDATPDMPPLLIAYGVEGRIQLLAPDAIPEITHALRNLPRVPSCSH